MSDLTILQIAHDHPAFTNGGTEWIANDLARALDSRDDARATLLCATTSLSRPEAPEGSLENLGPDLLLRTGGYDAFSMTRLDGPAWTRSLDAAIERIRPDVVHLHGLDRIGSEIVPFLRSRSPKLRIVLTLHDFQIICANDGLMVASDGSLCRAASPHGCRRCLPDIPMSRHALRTAHLKAVLHHVDHFIAPSEIVRDRFVDWGVPAGRISVIANAVPDAAGAERAAFQGHRFAFFGNLAEHKGVYTLLDAAARLASRKTRVDIRLHGGFTWATDLQRARFAAALDRARPVAQHFGPYPREDVQSLMHETDWVVVPSLWWENAPLVILEAQRAGRPVICSGIGGMAELVEHGRTGLHVPVGDAATLADTIEAAASDRDVFSRLTRNIVPPSTPDQFAEAHLSLYRNLLQEVSA